MAGWCRPRRRQRAGRNLPLSPAGAMIQNCAHRRSSRGWEIQGTIESHDACSSLRQARRYRDRRFARWTDCQSPRPVSSEARLLRKTAHLGICPRSLGRDHLVAEIGRLRLHRRHHLQADALALESIGDGDGEIAMPCSRIIGVVRFADDRALPFLPDLRRAG